MRFWLLLGSATLAFLSPAAADDDREAAALFRDMENKIKRARTVEIAFAYQLQGHETKGTLQLSSDNKVKLQLRGRFAFGVENAASFEFLSDGATYRTKGGKLVIASNGQAGFDVGGQSAGKTPKNFHAVCAATVSRAGIAPLVLGLPYLVAGEFDPNDEGAKMKTYDFQKLALAKVGPRSLQVLRYRYGKGGNDDADLTLWIEAETGLPLKRTFVLTRGNRLRISEEYARVKLGGIQKARPK